MTVKELSKLYHLNREVELNKRQLERLKRIAPKMKDCWQNCGLPLATVRLLPCRTCPKRTT